MTTPGSSKISLSLENSQYVSSGQSYFRSDAAVANTVLGIHFEHDRKWNSVLSTHLEVRNTYSAEENWNYLRPREAYVAYETELFGRGVFGRKYVAWSSWEESWNQGLFQPRYLQNKFRPESVGLLGWFSDFEMGKWRGTLAVLPIHIPDIGPHFESENQQFVSKNPWFHPPPSKFVLANQSGDINYSVRADLNKIISNPGLALKLEQRLLGFDTRVAFAYKPMPQVLLGFPSYHHLVVGDGRDYMQIEVAPRVVYHRVLSTDVRGQVGGWGLTLSSIYESPDRDEASSAYTAQHVEDAFIVSGTASHPIGTPGPQAPELVASVMKVWGGDAPDRGYFAGPTTLFERRYQYLEAFSLGFRSRSRLRGYPLAARGRVVYDSQQNGGAISFDGSMELTPHWRAQANIDFLGILDTSGKVRDGFLDVYRANDRVGVGVSYVY